MKRFSGIAAGAFAISALLAGCGGQEGWQTTTVTATAYNATEAQTKKGNIGLAAWGDQLVPGMRAIAVSRDLIEKGLRHNTEVKIEGLPGTWIVRDKMNKRWQNKIDIFMGLDEAAAREWGKREVTIRWKPAG
ncbi:3D domain-containing protein [Algiphilus sp.]|uniref:3D domain-containing protein n=1 Tax=Algiphilus sp. TaxID=1872431 RepID=UPI003BACD8E0